MILHLGSDTAQDQEPILRTNLRVAQLWWAEIKYSD